MNKDAFMDAMFKLSAAIKEIAIAVVDDTGDSIPIETFPNTDVSFGAGDAGNPADLAPAWTIPGAMTPWDERIHVGAKTKMAKAPHQWKKKKGGVSDEFLAQVEQEIAVRTDQGPQQPMPGQVPGTGLQGQVPGQIPQQPMSGSQIPQQPMSGGQIPQQLGAGFPQQSGGQIPQQSMPGQVPGIGFQQPMPQQPVGIPTFDEVMNLLSSLSAKNKLSSDLINSLIQQAGGTTLQDIANNPQCRTKFHQLLKTYEQ